MVNYIIASTVIQDWDQTEKMEWILARTIRRDNKNTTRNKKSYDPEVTNEEVEKSIKWFKDGKSPGPDDVHGEIRKLPEITILTKLVYNICETEHLPKDWLLPIFIPISKKPPGIALAFMPN